MNPHHEFGQAIRNTNTGRGARIIDSVPLTWATQGLTFLADTGSWDSSALVAVRRWFAGFLEWLTHSRNIRRPANWRKKQIVPFDGSGSHLLGLAGISPRNEQWLGIYRDRAKAEDPWRMLVDLLVRTQPD
jgi:Alginate lyase